MMTDGWNPDVFQVQLTASLSTALAARSATALQDAVGECAGAADFICKERPTACAAGCPHCCVLNVAALVPEALIITDWMRQRLSASEIADARKRLARHRAWARWMDDEERIAKHEVCPFLDAAGSCVIHPVRPIVCRAVTSLDSGMCRESLRPGIDDDRPLVLTDLLRRSVFDTAFLSLAEALRLHDYDSRSIELGVGVLGYLEHPEYREVVMDRGRLPDELWR